jgi:hypothetical protein
MRVPVSIRTSYFMADKKALVDSGATGQLHAPCIRKENGIGITRTPDPKENFQHR